MVCGNDQAIDRAYGLLTELFEATEDKPGVCRDSFGAGEAIAHQMLSREASRLDLLVKSDPIGNSYVTLPGLDRNRPILLMGSHLDSVHHGGNYDGAAGVFAGLAILERLRRLGVTPPFDITVMGIRAEEMVWFPTHYLGSRAAFGLLPADAPDQLRRSDTGRTLAEHMLEQDFQPDFIRQNLASLVPDKILQYLELHIEQGPVLVGANKSVAVVNAIRGNMRYRFARIFGETTHAGGVPRQHRRDAVLAGAELVSSLEKEWIRLEQQGRDLVLTIGEFATNATHHGITKVPGELAFTLDFRSTEEAVLDEFNTFLIDCAGQISERRRVNIQLGNPTRAQAVAMNRQIQLDLQRAAQDEGVEAMAMASGGGHDCVVFNGQGIPTGMVFVRNENGSHNPDEAMSLADFSDAWRVLANYIDGLLQTK